MDKMRIADVFQSLLDQVLIQSHMHLFAHTYISIIHACAHTCMHTYACAHIHTHTHTHMRVHTHIDTHTCTHTCMHACKHAHTHAHTRHLFTKVHLNNHCWQLSYYHHAIMIFRVIASNSIDLGNSRPSHRGRLRQPVQDRPAPSHHWGSRWRRQFSLGTRRSAGSETGCQEGRELCVAGCILIWENREGGGWGGCYFVKHFCFIFRVVRTEGSKM